MNQVVHPVDADHPLAELYPILQGAFTERELLSLHVLEEGIREHSTLAWGVYGQDRAFGIAVVEVYPSRTALLAYLAVAEDARGRGVGEALLTHVQSVVRSGPGFVLAEIELPGSVPDEPRFGDARRRARFYRRFGAKALDIRHWQPPVLPGLPHVPLCLIALPAPTPVGQRVTASDILAFESDYHRLDRDSPEARASIESLSQSEWVRTVDLEELFG